MTTQQPAEKKGKVLHLVRMEDSEIVDWLPSKVMEAFLVHIENFITNNGSHFY